MTVCIKYFHILMNRKEKHNQKYLNRSKCWNLFLLQSCLITKETLLFPSICLYWRNLPDVRNMLKNSEFRPQTFTWEIEKHPLFSGAWLRGMYYQARTWAIHGSTFARQISPFNHTNLPTSLLCFKVLLRQNDKSRICTLQPDKKIRILHIASQVINIKDFYFLFLGVLLFRSSVLVLLFLFCLISFAPSGLCPGFSYELLSARLWETFFSKLFKISCPWFENMLVGHCASSVCFAWVSVAWTPTDSAILNSSKGIGG